MVHQLEVQAGVGSLKFLIPIPQRFFGLIKAAQVAWAFGPGDLR